MAITITITDPTPEQIAAIFGVAAAAEEATVAKTTRTRKPKDEPAAEEVEQEAREDRDERVDTETGEVLEGPTREDVETAARALVKANGREAMADLLGQFKAPNLSGLKEADYAKFITKAEAACK